MASVSEGAIPRPFNSITGRNGLIDRYFYLAMSLLVAGIVVWGFSHTINASLIHAAPPRPLLLWIHGAAFSAWVAFYIFQSALVRTHNVKIHRTLGWFGVALASHHGPSWLHHCRHHESLRRSCAASVRSNVSQRPLRRHDHLRHLRRARGRLAPQARLHRRLLFIATCSLLDAPFGRIDYIFNNSLFYVFVDSVILLGVVRDLLVNRRIHKVYLVALPLIIAFHVAIVYVWRAAPAWWLSITRAILA